MTGFNGNTSVTKGRIAIDTTDLMIYCWYDLTGLKNDQGSSTTASISLAGTTAISFYQYLPSESNAKKITVIPLFDSLKSTDTQCYMYYSSSNYGLYVSRYGCKIGRQYKGYGMWSYQGQTNS